MKTVTSKSGKEILFRTVTLEDVPALQLFINTLSSERTFISFQGEQVTLEQETAFVASHLKFIDEKKGTHLLAFHNSRLIASSHIAMYERTERHIGLFSISVAKEFRGEGIGRMLMEAVIEEAKQNIPELEILILTVYANNGRACALYESFGFQKYGMLPQGVKLENGYADHVYMYKRVR